MELFVGFEGTSLPWRSWGGCVVSTCWFCIFPEPHNKFLAQTPEFQRWTSGSERLCSFLTLFWGRGCFQRQQSKIFLLLESPALLQCKYCGSACDSLKPLSGKSHRSRISRSFVKFLLLIYGIYTKGVEITHASADSLPPERAADLRNALTEAQGTELPSVPRRTSWTLNSASSWHSFLMCPAALQAPVCLKCHFLL